MTAESGAPGTSPGTGIARRTGGGYAARAVRRNGFGEGKMLAILRVWAVALIGLTVVYLALRVYLRSLERERLEKQFDAEQWDAERGDAGPTRDDYIRQGMARHARGLRLRLLWLVYILPLAAIAVTIYLVNYD